ncbi:hypothetical protein Vretifemale_15681, partial [Volvox reticuliferus]
KEWLDAVAALSRAANVECSLLVLRATKLPWSTQSSPSLNVQQQVASSKRKSSQLPLLWLQDLRASSLLANCSSSSDVRSTDEQKDISRLIRRLMPARLGPTPAASPPVSATSMIEGYEDDQNLLPALLSTMQACRYTTTPSLPDEEEGAMALAVPATHMRLISFDGLILVPAKGGSSSRSSGGNLTQIQSTSTNGTAAVPYLTSIDDGSTFRGKDIEALVIAPNTLFDLSMQLYDGLGQPVTVDTPTFSVSLRILPKPVDITSVSVSDDKFALLRTEGLSDTA